MSIFSVCLQLSQTTVAQAATDNTFVFASPEAAEGVQRRTEAMRFGKATSKSATASDDDRDKAEKEAAAAAK